MIEIKFGDCFEEMKKIESESVDMICTDPPYGMDYKNNYPTKDFIQEDVLNDKGLDWLPDFIDECYRIAKDNTAHVFFCSRHKIDVFKQAIERKFKISNLLVWKKSGGGVGDCKGALLNVTEFAFLAKKGIKHFSGKRDNNVMEFKKAGCNLHPTQKPVEMMSYLISKWSSKDELILDPFVGSGTTAVACKALDRRFLGFELSETHFKTATTRIALPVSSEMKLRLERCEKTLEMF